MEKLSILNRLSGAAMRAEILNNEELFMLAGTLAERIKSRGRSWAAVIPDVERLLKDLWRAEVAAWAATVPDNTSQEMEDNFKRARDRLQTLKKEREVPKAMTVEEEARISIEEDRNRIRCNLVKGVKAVHEKRWVNLKGQWTQI